MAGTGCCKGCENWFENEDDEGCKLGLDYLMAEVVNRDGTKSIVGVAYIAKCPHERRRG